MKTNFLIILIFVFHLLYITTSFAGVIVADSVFSAGSGLNNQRTIVRDSDGNLYIAYPKNYLGYYHIFIAFSSDGGATWDPHWATITSGDKHNIQVSLAIDSYDTLHLVWVGNLTSIGSNNGDLMYRKYPGGTNTVICAYSGYPGAHCPSIAVGPDDDIHVVYSGCPSGWRVRYLHYDRATDSWDPPEDVGTHTPSRWPSVEIDSDNDVHLIYRNQPAAHYRTAHREKTGGSWLPVEQIDIHLNSVEYSSIYIDKWDNIHATWVFRNTFYGNPDTVRYRRYNNSAATWETIYSIFGTDTSLTYCGDVVVDTMGIVYVFYHNFDSVYLSVSYDGGLSFPVDSAVSDTLGCRYPNARGSNYPEFNRVYDECIDFVYTWRNPTEGVNYLIYDNLCGISPAESTIVCAEFIEPLESSFTSCSDQEISVWIDCCPGTDTIIVRSDTNTVEFFDSTTMSWQPSFAPPPTMWLSQTHIDSAVWVWTDDYPAPTYHGDWFRTIINSDCDYIDTAYIAIQCDNKAYIYVNGVYVDTTDGNPGTGSRGWRTRYEFDLTAFIHGGEDTVTIMGYNSSGQAGLIFEIVVVCDSLCCGEIDTSSLELTVNEDSFTISDPELLWDGTSILTFAPIPPDTFEDGDTISACLISAADTCGGTIDSVICRTFFVDLSAPVIFNISPAPDTITEDSLPTVEFLLFDSLSGLDTSSILFYVDSIVYTPEISWADSCWHISWTPSSPFSPGDTVEVCVYAEDTTDYCEDNILDSCWIFYINPCVPALTWLICPPETSFAFWSSCSSQVATFGMWDPTGSEIDTRRIYFTGIIQHNSGITDTIIPSMRFTFEGDTVIATTYWHYEDGDTVEIILDSLFTTDGCRTVP